MERKRTKKFGAILLASSIILSGFGLASPASAATTQHLWDENTKSVIDPSILNSQPVVDETANVQDINIEGTNKEGIAPMAIFRTLVRYDQSSAIVDLEKKYVGIFIVDNRSNQFASASMTYEADSSDTFGVEATTGISVSAEKDLVVAKVNGTVSVGATASRSWTRGTKYGASTTVPAKTLGAAKAFIPGTSTKGQMVYKLTTDSTGEVRYEYVPVGAVVPSKSAWNIKFMVPYTPGT